MESDAIWVAAEPFTIRPMSEMESLAWVLHQQYPGMEIMALDDETIVIKTNGCNKENIRIDAFGMELNGEEIIIRRTAVTVEGEIVGTNYFVQVKDDLFLSTANLTSNKDKSVFGVKANISTTPVTLSADITVLRDGSISADMWI